MRYMSPFPLIPTKSAIAHYGRSSDGYGGKAALAKILGITIPAIDRWSSAYLPEHHAKKLLSEDHTAECLVVESAGHNTSNAARGTNRTRATKAARKRKPA